MVAKGARQNTKASSSRRPRDSGLPSELVEDVDRFVDGRNKLMMGREDDSEEEGEGDEVILGVGGDDDDDDDDEGEDISDAGGEDDEDEDEGMGDGIRSGRNLEGLESDEDEANKEEGGWGKNRSDYYDVDQMSDSEAEEEEEKEARRIRAKQSDALKSADFGEDEVVSDEEDDTIGARASGKPKKIAKKVVSLRKDKKKPGLSAPSMVDEHADEEKVERDLTGLSAEERMDILANSAPELKSLVADMKRHLKEIRTQLIPLQERAKLGIIASPEGESYIACKMRLLTSYCTNVAFYLLLKTEGKAVKNHPVIDQLVDLRSHLERLAPLDELLQDEIKQLLNMPIDEGMLLRKNIRDVSDENDEEKDSDEEDFDKMDFDAMQRDLAKMSSDQGAGGKRKAKKTASKGSDDTRVLSTEVREEFMDDDEEEEDEVGEGARRKRRKAKQGINLETMDDFGDGDDAVDKDGDTSAIRFAQKRTLRDYVRSQDQANKARQKNRMEASGEADVPIRDRRAEIQKVADRKQRIMAKAVAAEHRQDEEREARQMVGGDMPEDDYYQQVKAAQEAMKVEKKKAKKEQRNRMEYIPEQTIKEGEKREAGNFIVKNRGLVPHRSKDKKNPRVKHRKKFEKAKVKERTSFFGKQTRDDRAAYGGETTGIKANISRSRKF